MAGAVKDWLWDENDLFSVEEPHDHQSLDELASSVSFEDWGQDR